MTGNTPLPTPAADHDLQLVREALEACQGDDFRILGCVCAADKECYLHAHTLPEAQKALARIEAVNG